MQFPIYHAALSFEGKPPEELPHGLLTMPPEVREFFAEQSAKSPPGTFARDEVRILNLWTIAWYFDGLHHEVIYRETPEGPEVLAVGYDEMFAFRKNTPPEEQRKLKGYLGY